MASPFIGEIVIFAGNFAPRSWALCDGQLMAINSNQALFSILGTTYGGDGRTTFGIPEMRGRVSTHEGSGPGLNPVSLGQRSGANNAALNTTNLPSHNHAVQAVDDDPNTTNVSNNAFANGGSYSSAATDAGTRPTGNQGGGQSFSIMQPFLGLNYIIAITGVFPSRN